MKIRKLALLGLSLVLAGGLAAGISFNQNNQPVYAATSEDATKLAVSLEVNSDGVTHNLTLDMNGVNYVLPKMTGSLNGVCQYSVTLNQTITPSDYINITVDGVVIDSARRYWWDSNDNFSHDQPTERNLVFRRTIVNPTISLGAYFNGSNVDYKYYCMDVYVPLSTFTVSYDKNCEDDLTPIADQVVETGTHATIENGFVRNGYIFKGWSTTDDGAVEYNPGDSLLVENNVTLYAVWAETKTLSYNKNCEDALSPIADQVVEKGTNATVAQGFNRKGYSFNGWSTTSNGSVEYNPGDSIQVNTDITLYAVWEELEPSGQKIVFKRITTVSELNRCSYGNADDDCRIVMASFKDYRLGSLLARDGSTVESVAYSDNYAYDTIFIDQANIDNIALLYPYYQSSDHTYAFCLSQSGTHINDVTLSDRLCCEKITHKVTDDVITSEISQTKFGPTQSGGNYWYSYNFSASCKYDGFSFKRQNDPTNSPYNWYCDDIYLGFGEDGFNHYSSADDCQVYLYKEVLDEDYVPETRDAIMTLHQYQAKSTISFGWDGSNVSNMKLKFGACLPIALYNGLLAIDANATFGIRYTVDGVNYTHKALTGAFVAEPFAAEASSTHNYFQFFVALTEAKTLGTIGYGGVVTANAYVILDGNTYYGIDKKMSVHNYVNTIKDDDQFAEYADAFEAILDIA